MTAFLLLAELGLRVVGCYYLDNVYGHPGRHGGINVICLGESSTEGLWTGPGEPYPDQLEVLLRNGVSPHINVIVPPHVGQNSSQVAARVPDYLQRYHPRLVIIMLGIYNEWALRESNLGLFIHEGTARSLWIRAQIALDGLRLFRVGRWLYLRFTVHEKDPDAVKGEGYAVYGHPGFTRYPPPEEVFSFSGSHTEAFMQLWRYDVRRIIDEVKAGGATPVLMTYHIPGFVPVEEFIKMAEETHTPLVRNDLTFAALAKNGTLNQYVFPQDHWHPNKQGYTLIAKNVFDVISGQKLLGLP